MLSQNFPLVNSFFEKKEEFQRNSSGIFRALKDLSHIRLYNTRR